MNENKYIWMWMSQNGSIEAMSRRLIMMNQWVGQPGSDARMTVSTVLCEKYGVYDFQVFYVWYGCNGVE